MVPTKDALGRPSLLTPAKHSAIVAGFASGMTQRTIAGAAGIGRTTLVTWLRLGELEEMKLRTRGFDPDAVPLDSELVPADTRSYRELYRAVEAARDDVINETLATVTMAATGQAEKITRTTMFKEGVEVGEQVKVEGGRDVKAAMWLLERLDRQRFGRVIQSEEELAAIQVLIVGRVMNGIAEEYPELVTTEEGQAKLRRILTNARDSEHHVVELRPGDHHDDLEGSAPMSARRVKRSLSTMADSDG